MSSLDGKLNTRDPEMPPALSSMWRLCKLGYQHEPALMLVAFRPCDETNERGPLSDQTNMTQQEAMR